MPPSPLLGEDPTPSSSSSAFEQRYPRTPRRQILGQGCFGVVFAVTAANDPGQQYVAKEISMASVGPKQQREALVEFDLLRSLNHPYIVRCVDAMLIHTSLYIVMEYANGGDLALHIRTQRDLEQRLPEATIMRVFAQAAMALKFVHAKKVLHRDIKPANMFVFGPGALDASVVKLGDFGLGKMFEGTTFEALSVVGSPAYFSPEVCKGKPYGRKSDVWSLGVVLYELAALVVPFPAKAILAAAVMICKTEHQELPAEYSVKFRDLVGRLLQKEPKVRPAITAVLEEPFVSQFATSPVLDMTPRLEESREPEAEVSPSAQSRPTTASRETSDTIMEEVRRHYPEGVVPLDVCQQLLLAVVPGMTNNSASRVLAASGCGGQGGVGGETSVNFGQFMDWLGRGTVDPPVN